MEFSRHLPFGWTIRLRAAYLASGELLTDPSPLTSICCLLTPASFPACKPADGSAYYPRHFPGSMFGWSRLHNSASTSCHRRRCTCQRGTRAMSCGARWGPCSGGCAATHNAQLMRGVARSAMSRERAAAAGWTSSTSARSNGTRHPSYLQRNFTEGKGL